LGMLAIVRLRFEAAIAFFTLRWAAVRCFLVTIRTFLPTGAGSLT
jgi:hypothetical protein